MKLRPLGALLCILCLGVPLSAAERDTLVVGNAADVKTLDPHVSTDRYSNVALSQIFDTLVTMDEKGGFSGQLAESWEIPDPVTYVFRLRKGVKFHNGEELTADDVLFSMERANSPLAASIKGYATLVDLPRCEVRDRYTVVIRTKEPTAPFMAILSTQLGQIMNRKAVEASGDETNVKPVGTGPFMFEQWIRGDRVVLRRFDGYWGKKPCFKTIVLRAIPETTSRMIEAETGNLDFCFYVQPNQVKELEESGKVSIIRAPGNRINFLGLNYRVKPFDNPKVREAIDYALDKEGIIAAVYYGLAAIPPGPWPSDVKYALPDTPLRPYDVEKARALLKEAGYDKGFKVKIYASDTKENIDMATIIQAQLAAVGIQMEIVVLEWGTYLDSLYQGTMETFIGSWGASVKDPYFYLNRTMHSRGIGATNDVRLSDPEIDRLLDEAIAVPDGPERGELYKQLWKKLNAGTVWCRLAVPELLYAKKPGLKGTENFEKVLNTRFDGFYYEE